MKPTPYNPDAPINARQRSKNALARISSGDPVRTFSPWELEELRLDFLLLPSPRAERFVTLIDQADAAADLEMNVSAALDAADLEGLKEKIDNARDEINGELDRETEDDLGDRLLTAMDHAQTKAAVLKWYSERIKAIREEVTEHLDKLHAHAVDADSALSDIS
jgi:hypothetical protein